MMFRMSLIVGISMECFVPKTEQEVDRDKGDHKGINKC
jgi:hypothetical protein